MKAIHELFDDWENGTLTVEELQQLKQQLADPAAKAELRRELGFYGLLNDVLGIYEVSPEVEARLGKSIFERSPLAGISRLFERWIPRPLRSAPALITASLLLLSGAGLLIWYQQPRPIGVLSQANEGTRIRRAGKEFPGVLDAKLYSGDSVISPQFGSAAVGWKKEQTKFYLAPSTEIAVKQKWLGKEVTLARGEVKAIVAKQYAKRPLIVKSPHAVARVLGTRFTLSAVKNRSRLEVVEGKMEFKELGTNRSPALVLTTGQYAQTGAGVSAQASKIDGMLWWEVWLAGSGPLSSDVPAPSTILNQDYLPSSQTLIWLYPFLTDPSKKYRERIRAILTPEETGDYLFWMMSGGASELWLSTDASPSNKALVASTPAPAPGAKLVPTWNWVLRPGLDQSAMRDTPWNKFPSQKSKPIRLIAGQRYYLEALHDADPKDAMAIIWAKPGGDTLIPSGTIPSQYLSPFRD